VRERSEGEKHIGRAGRKLQISGVGTTEGFDSEWEELSARGLKLEKVLVFVDFRLKAFVAA
jgi:hypothetical protein